jgi:indole-3-glycerol phosphate synthase
LGEIPSILAKIVDRKQRDVGPLRARRSRLEQEAARSVHARRDFQSALRRSGPAIIAECKKASPSKGLFRSDYEAARIAAEYERAGAAAVSVLTDDPFFQGSLEDLRAARQSVSIPLLRKDFTIDEVQIVEAAASGADAILLIAALLSESQMRAFRERAAEFGMAALVEVHDASELDAALASGARMVGVNNRDLRTFEVRLETALELAPRIPDTVVRVAESGIHSGKDVNLLWKAGYQAFLVGEHLMLAADTAARLRELVSPVEAAP